MSYANKLRPMDTEAMTVREVAIAVGCGIDTAGNLLRYLKKPYRKLPPTGVNGQHHEQAGPDLDRVERQWECLMRGRSYDSHAIRPTAFARLSGPELTHTAGGTSAGSCADSGATYRPTPPERTKDEVRAGVKRLFLAGHTYGAIADQLGLTRHRVSGLCYRMGLLRGNEKMAAVAAAKRAGGE